MKSSKVKIAFTGTNSSGKTTWAMLTTGRLKAEYDVLAELVSSQDRKITWSDGHFPVDDRAHFGMICNLINAEVQAELKGDAEVVITDRSVLDLYAIALTDHPYSPRIQALGETVKAWVSTYTKIYYLPPLRYQEDGKRPPDEFRMKTHATLLSLMDKWETKFECLVRDCPREDTFKDVLKTLGISVKNLPFEEQAKFQKIADTLECDLLVKNSKSVMSDTDIWVSFASLEETSKKLGLVKDHLGMLFDKKHKFDIMTTVMPVVAPLNTTLYKAKK